MTALVAPAINSSDVLELHVIDSSSCFSFGTKFVIRAINTCATL